MARGGDDPGRPWRRLAGVLRAWPVVSTANPVLGRVNVQPATQLPACSHVDVSGISQVPRRSVLCLCLGPRPRPNQRSLAYLSVSSMLPPLRGQRRLQRVSYFGAIARLQHLLPTLQEWCCHHPCKARFRLAGLPLPGGSRTLWIALKGFRSHSHSPFLDLSWRYRDELPPSHRSSLLPLHRQPIPAEDALERARSRAAAGAICCAA